MRSGKSCFKWPSIINEKEVTNPKSRLNCQELTVRPTLGEHLTVGNARNSSFWSFKTGLNKTPRQREDGCPRTAPREAVQKAFSCPSISTKPSRTERTWKQFTRGDLRACRQLSEPAALSTQLGQRRRLSR